MSGTAAVIGAVTSRRRTVVAVWVIVAVLGTAAPAVAQARPAEVQRAIEAERAGRYQEAADRFERILKAEPASFPALLGFERALQRLGRLDRILVYIDAAIPLAADQQPVRSLQLRVLAQLGRTDALNAAAEAWIATVPKAEDPYREWAFALAQRGDIEGARQVLLRGGRVLGAGALLQELAQVAVASGDWPGAARHWVEAARAKRPAIPAAGLSLSHVPPAMRAGVLDVLLRELGDSVAQMIAADALVSWDRAGEAWALLDRVLPADPRSAVAALRRFADRTRHTTSAEAARMRGYALERLATLVQGPEAQQARIDAARGFADAGDRRAAERMLHEIAGDSAVAPAAASGAMATLIAVTADAGRAAAAERRLREWRDRLRAEDVALLETSIARAWVRAGELARANSILGDDSSVGAAAVRGWVALYRGDLRGASRWFREAGPYAGTRARITRRTSMLALIQRIGPDSVPELGRALLMLERGDTSRAVDQLVDVARTLPHTAGRGDVLGLAGRLALAHRDRRAEPLLLEALAVDATGPVAPAAMLALARIAAKAGPTALAIERLESLILLYPESAVVPEARRLLNQVRGAIPRS